MSFKDRIAVKLFGRIEADRLADCIDAGIAQVAKMGHISPEEVRANFDSNLMLCGFSMEEVRRLHTDEAPDADTQADESDEVS